MSKRAVIYARVSKDDRGNDGRNLIGQVEMCREYALEKGWIIVAELAEDDRGAKGASFDLAKLNQALQMARDRKYDVLVVREIDRFARYLAKQLIIEEELKRNKVDIEYVLGEYPDTPEGNLNKNIKAVIAEYERLKIVERVTRGTKRKVKSGSVMVYGQPPYGYRQIETEDNKWMLEIYEPEARIVRMMFNWFVNGDKKGNRLSLLKIVERLNNMGIPTYGSQNKRKNPRRGEWSKSSIHYILKNETYAGVWYFGKRRGQKEYNPSETWIPVEVPAIVERELWGAAQARLKENQADSSRNLKYKTQYLLRRRMACSMCGSKVLCRSCLDKRKGKGRRYFYYRCGANASPEAHIKTCNCPGFRAEQVDKVVWEWVVSILKSPEELAKGLGQVHRQHEQALAPLRERLNIVDDLIDENERKLDRLLDLYISGDYSKELLVERKGRLEKTIEALQQEQTHLINNLEMHELSSKQIRDIEIFAADVSRGLDLLSLNFNARRKLIEDLGVEATMYVEDDQKVVYVRCFLGKGRINLPPLEQLNEFTSARNNFKNNIQGLGMEDVNNVQHRCYYQTQNTTDDDINNVQYH